MHGFMIDAMMGDTMGKLAFWRCIFYVLGALLKVKHIMNTLQIFVGLLQTRAWGNPAGLERTQVNGYNFNGSRKGQTEEGPWLGKMEDFATTPSLQV
jgi:hypothetical protein